MTAIKPVFLMTAYGFLLLLFACGGTTLDDTDGNGASEAKYMVYTSENGLSDNTVTDILVDYVRNGLWCATLNGVSFYSHDDSTWTVFGAEYDIPKMETYSLAFDGMTASVWLGTVSGPAQYTDDWHALADMDSLVHRYIKSVAAMADGSIWFGTNGGISVHSPLGGWTSHTIVSGLPDNDINAIAAGPRNEVWVATMNGVGVYDGDSWRQYGSAVLSSPVAYTVFKTLNGIIWIGTANGISTYDGENWKKYGTFDGLPSPVVYDFTEDWTNILWAATDAGAAQMVNGKWIAFSLPAEVKGERINALASDIVHGVIWIGTDKGLVMYTPSVK